MPSLLHEALIALVRERPQFAADLLRGVLHVDVPAFTEARLAEAALPELIPAEYHADAVVLFVDSKPVFGVILEAQLQTDARKGFTWPVYTINARARFECPFVLVVVTPDARTARWASQRIELGGGMWWAPFVVGPDGIPVITEVERARREPELAVLSVMAHGKGEQQTAVAVALAAMAAVEQIPAEYRMLYFGIIETALGDAARKAFEMHPQTEKFFSESQRRFLEKGRAEGHAEGRAEGRAEGIIDVLEARSFAVSDEQRARIFGCTDIETLARWLRRAVTVTSVDELFL